jgi:phospholipid/cholesterol/gamma-HCH transport system ATP-binding protein
MMVPKIKVQNLYKSFGENHVLKDMSFSINPGESLVIIGGSGTGKSVAIKCILGLLKADKGLIEVDGQDLSKLSKHDYQEVLGKFGMLFQGGALFDSLPVWENIAFRLINRDKVSKNKAKDIAVEKLEAVGLKPEVSLKYPAELSGGMQKRVGLARAIATNPEIIFFDEPTTGLDPIMCSVIDNLIVKCVKDIGATALSITHDMRSVQRIADHVGLLYKGKIIWTGTTKEMLTSKDPYVQQFINGEIEGPMSENLIRS